MPGKQYTFAELAQITKSKLVGDPERSATGVNALVEACSEDVSFLANQRYADAMKTSKAGLICIDHQTPLHEGKNFLISENPSRAFQIIVELLQTTRSTSAFQGIHPTAIIASNVQLGQNVTIGPYAVIDQNVRIGDGTRIGAHCWIGVDVELGFNCELHPSCVVREGSRLGNRVILQSGAIIGSCGFGYTTDQQGRHQKLEQLGIVVLEDDVEIGANTTIDRARFKTTLIKQGTKIDNLVQIAHNVEIGAYNLIAAQTGIAGSAKTGHHVMMGGQVGVLGHIELDNQVMLATRSGASKSLKSGTYRGSPAIPLSEFNRQEVHVRKLEEYVKRIKDLEQRLSVLEQSN